MSSKIQAFEKHNKADDRDIQIQREEYEEKPISALHYNIREEQPKAFQTASLNISSNLIEFLNDIYPQGSIRTDWTPVTMLDLRRVKEVIVSYGMYSPIVKQVITHDHLAIELSLKTGES